MKRCFYIIYLFVISVSLVHGQESVSTSEYTAIISIKDGKITGDYESYYANGRLKSSGKLKNSLRTDLWKFYDSTGHLLYQRKYSSPREYTNVPSENDNLINLLRKSQFVPSRTKEGFYEIEKIEAQHAVLRHKLWRSLYPTHNRLLFENNQLANIIINSLQNNTAVYEDDRFTRALNNDSCLFKIKEHKIIGYKIKEEFVFDKRNMLSNYVVLGIAPIGYHPQLQDSSDLFWIYYPDFRKTLAQATILPTDDSIIENIDDVIYWRDFSGILFKTTNNNPYDVELKNYPHNKKSIAQMALEEDVEMIEKENNLLIFYNYIAPK